MNRLPLPRSLRSALPLLLLVSGGVAAQVRGVPGSLAMPASAAALSSPAPGSVGVMEPEDSAAWKTEPASAGEPASAVLPDAPSSVPPVTEGAAFATSDGFAYVPQGTGNATPNVAPRLTKYIPSGWTAQRITAHDKALIGLRDLYSPLNFLAMLASAGYEQALNGEPNYGTDRGAFGERLGAAAIRESTQGLFTDSVFAPLFHEDPRYYVMGPGHNVVRRAFYAATRPLIARTDGGRNTINAALLAGYASSAALSYTYYPQINKNFHDTASTFAGSLGGAALGFAVSEFSDDLLKAVHLRKK